MISSRVLCRREYSLRVNTAGKDDGRLLTGVVCSGAAIGGDPAGHHKILVDKQYKRIGCAFTRNPNADTYWGQGLWVCDLKGS